MKRRPQTHALEIIPNQSTKQKEKKKKEKRKRKKVNVCHVFMTSLQGPAGFTWSAGAHFWLLCGYLDWLRHPLGSVHDHEFGQKIVSFPYNTSFHLQPQAGPGVPFGARNIKTWGHRLTRRALLSITASPSLLPFTPGSWTHRCQPGNNRQTIEA